MIRGGYRFPACAKPLVRFIVWLGASAGEARSERIMRQQIVARGSIPSTSRHAAIAQPVEQRVASAQTPDRYRLAAPTNAEVWGTSKDSGSPCKQAVRGALPRFSTNFVEAKPIGLSFNGRTPDSDSGDHGSNPWRPANCTREKRHARSVAAVWKHLRGRKRIFFDVAQRDRAASSYLAGRVFDSRRRSQGELTRWDRAPVANRSRPQGRGIVPSTLRQFRGSGRGF